MNMKVAYTVDFFKVSLVGKNYHGYHDHGITMRIKQEKTTELFA